MKPLRQILEAIGVRIGALITEMFLGERAAKPDPAKPIPVIWYYAEKSARGQRLFIFLPGRRDRAVDFARHGFIAMAQRRLLDLDCVAVEATIGYYLDGSLADRIQREIVMPARAYQYRETGSSVFPWVALEPFSTSALFPAK